MKSSLKTIIIISFISLVLVGCKPDSLFEGLFYMQIDVVNNTETELVLERHETSGDFNVTKYIKDGSETLAFGEYGGSKGDDYPPEEVVVDALRDVSIYRNVNGELQELPRNWFNNLNAFEINKDYWFGNCTVTYQITVTEEMFSDREYQHLQCDKSQLQ